MTDTLDTTFAALSDPIRRAILARLAQGEATVSELARPFDVSLPAISRHLRVLEQAGLLERTRVGRMHRCRLRENPLRDAQQWITEQQTHREQRQRGAQADPEPPTRRE